MNKQDLSELKKNFKSESKVSIQQVYTIYLNKENREIVSERHEYFARLPEDEQEIYMKNFKKLLTGDFNSKLFELNFNEEVQDSSKEIFENLLDSDDTDTISEHLNQFVSKVVENFNYETDIVINFIKFDFYVNATEGEDGENENNGEALNFIMVSINKLDKSKKQFIFDYVNRDFNLKSEQNPIINMSSPVDGILYPLYEDRRTNVSKLLNYTAKANKINEHFITEVINCNVVPTVKQEKEAFEEILKTVLNEKVKPDTLQEIYMKISDKFEGETEAEFRTIQFNTVQEILADTGVDTNEVLEMAYETVVESTDYEFRVDSILPNFDKKSITIVNEQVEVKTTPDNLEKVKQVRDENGNLFLLLKLDSNTNVNGFNIDTERIQNIRFEEETEE